MSWSFEHGRFPNSKHRTNAASRPFDPIRVDPCSSVASPPCALNHNLAADLAPLPRRLGAIHRALDLQGMMGSTTQLVETMATHLVNLWQWRRGHPAGLRQPAEQWKDGPSSHSKGFNGYVPGSLSLSPGMGMMHLTTARRFHAAALDDAARSQWAAFD